MSIKLFISTFLMIFLAELGDKTQLAVIGRINEASTKWTVFAASTLALILSTFIAVQFGGWLTRHVDPRAIKLGAGLLFLAIGGWTLYEAFRTPASVTADDRPIGTLGRFVLSQAVRFEQAAFEDYRKLARRAVHPELRRLLGTLAEEEAGHARKINAIDILEPDPGLSSHAVAKLPTDEALMHDVATNDAPLLEHTIEHEEATAAFYEQLARDTSLPGLKNVFATLAAGERSHVERLQAFRDRNVSDAPDAPS